MIRERQSKSADSSETTQSSANDTKERDFEGGFGGQEELEDRYAVSHAKYYHLWLPSVLRLFLSDYERRTLISCISQDN